MNIFCFKPKDRDIAFSKTFYLKIRKITHSVQPELNRHCLHEQHHPGFLFHGNMQLLVSPSHTMTPFDAPGKQAF